MDYFSFQQAVGIQTSCPLVVYLALDAADVSLQQMSVIISLYLWSESTWVPSEFNVM